MASHSTTRLLIRRLAPAAALMVRLAAAPSPMTLEQASSRQPPDFGPAHAGKIIAVKGVVSTPVMQFRQYAQVGIQDASHALLLEGSPASFRKLAPGDEVEVVGRLGNRAGLVVLTPEEIRVLSHGGAPPPESVDLEKLKGFRYLGRLVMIEARVVRVDVNTEGPFLLVGDSKDPYKIFLPYASTNPRVSFNGIGAGDLVRVTGVSSQYCPLPPYNRWFEMVVLRPGDVVRVAKAPLFDPVTLGAVLAALVLLAVALWRRDHRLRAQREMVAAAHELGEQVLGLSSAAEILRQVAGAFPRIFGVSRVRLYLYDRRSKSLNEIQAVASAEPVSIRLDAPAGIAQSGAAACFQNRVQFAIPDTAGSPFTPGSGERATLPRSLLFVPMFAQGDVIGVFEIGQDRRPRVFKPAEQTLAQHLGNQIGLAIQLFGQRTVREQLFRTEKLAAVGRLISGVVNELQAPLATIRKMADTAIADDPYSAADRELRIIASEAKRASEMVARLVTYAGGEQVEARPVEVNQLLRSLLEFRAREWKVLGIRLHNLLADRPMVVLGSQGQLEQVLLNLLVHAEQCLAEAGEKVIVLRSSLLARRVLIEIGYNRAEGAEDVVDPFSKWSEGSAGGMGLGVCRSILAGHGGDVRLVESHGNEVRFEVELPEAGGQGEAPSPAGSRSREQSRRRTALLMEPDDPIERQLQGLLSSRGYRVVPVKHSDVGLEMAQRLRFDIAFCSVRLPGLNWVELAERFHRLTAAFVLLADIYDPDLAITFEGDGHFVLAKPIDEVQLDRVLAFAENLPPRHEALAG